VIHPSFFKGVSKHQNDTCFLDGCVLELMRLCTRTMIAANGTTTHAHLCGILENYERPPHEIVAFQHNLVKFAKEASAQLVETFRDVEYVSGD
jgi:hypothetical protein